MIAWVRSLAQVARASDSIIQVSGALLRAHEERDNFERDVLKKLEQIGKQLMALTQESKDLILRFDAATTVVSQKIQDLIDRIEAGTISDQAELAAALRPIAAHLEAIGSDPANPFPPTL